MGSEFGQWREWNHDVVARLAPARSAAARRPAAVRDGPEPLYAHEPALHEVDFDAGGIRVDRLQRSRSRASSRSSAAPRRRRLVVAVLNWTPIVRDDYRIGVPEAGYYAELLNSDAGYYGGSNVGNEGGVDDRADCRARAPAVAQSDAAAARATLVFKPERRRPSPENPASHCSSVTGITDSRGMRSARKSRTACPP